VISSSEEDDAAPLSSWSSSSSLLPYLPNKSMVLCSISLRFNKRMIDVTHTIIALRITTCSCRPVLKLCVSQIVDGHIGSCLTTGHFLAFSQLVLSRSVMTYPVLTNYFQHPFPDFQIRNEREDERWGPQLRDHRRQARNSINYRAAADPLCVGHSTISDR
jgi:hypothetical protein